MEQRTSLRKVSRLLARGTAGIAELQRLHSVSKRATAAGSSCHNLLPDDARGSGGERRQPGLRQGHTRPGAGNIESADPGAVPVAGVSNGVCFIGHTLAGGISEGGGVLDSVPRDHGRDVGAEHDRLFEYLFGGGVAAAVAEGGG